MILDFSFEKYIEGNNQTWRRAFDGDRRPGRQVDGPPVGALEREPEITFSVT